MKFFRDFGHSVYGPSYYRELSTKSTWYSVRCFLLLMLCAAAVQTVFLWVSAASVYRETDGFRELKQEILGLYPDGLQISVGNGVITTNVDEPYAIATPSSWRQRDGDFPSNLIVFDTGGDVSLSDFRRFDTVVVVGRDVVGVYDVSDGKYTLKTIGDMRFDPITVTKDDYISIVDKGGDILKGMGSILMILLPIVMYVFFLAWNAAYLVFGAVVVWVIARIRGQTVSYGAAYRYGMHLITLPVIYAVLSVTIFDGHSIPFVGTILLAIAAGVNLKNLTGFTGESGQAKHSLEAGQ